MVPSIGGAAEAASLGPHTHSRGGLLWAGRGFGGSASRWRRLSWPRHSRPAPCEFIHRSTL
eukprot:3502733-Prymnesium_polylepis.1